jgi:hypothetical protein
MGFRQWLKKAGPVQELKPARPAAAAPAPAATADASPPFKLSEPSAGFLSRHSDLIEGVRSGKSETRLSSLGVLVNSMWSSDPQEQADAMKFVASVLRHPDLATVHKAAGALAERGEIATLYMERAALDPSLGPEARAAILSRARMVESAGRGHMRLAEELTEAQLDAGAARSIFGRALLESRFHGFSSHWAGKLSSGDGVACTFVLELDPDRPVEMQVLISIGRSDKTPASDQICRRLGEALAPGTERKEIQGIPTSRGLRYFGWRLPPPE